MTRRLVVLTFTWVALFAFGLSGQQGQPTQPPVFRAGAEAVEFDVFVTDRNGNAVTDLTASDFAIEEDGVAQTISAFSLVNIPLKSTSPAAVTLAEPDVQTNERLDGRLYIFAIDTLTPTFELRTRRFLRRFVEEHFDANDVAALVYVGQGQARNTQDFTGNQRLLLRAVDNVMSGFTASGAPSESASSQNSATQMLLDGGMLTLRSDALRRLTESLAQIRGKRKVMLFFTHGVGFDVLDLVSRPDGAKSVSFDDLHAAIGAATRGGVAIYPIDPRGLTLDGSIDDAVDLRSLAYSTGGEAIVNTNRIPEGLARIVRENSSYYVLGFSSTNTRREGRFRNVRVRVTRPGLEVKTRKGYLEPLKRTDPPAMTPIGSVATALTTAVRQPLSNPTVPMQVFAAPFRLSEREARVVIVQEMDVAGLGLMREGNELVGDVTATTIAVRFDAKVFGGKALSTPTRIASDSGQPVRVQSEIVVPPGRYQLRVAGGTTARAGSVMYDLEVPDFGKGALVLGGVSLSAGGVTTRRDFDGSETLSLYTELYENVKKAPAHSVDLTAELRAADGRVVRTVTQQRPSQELAANSGFTLNVPLSGTSAGEYLLHVEARSNTATRAVVSRDIPIRIR